ncbi:hypothetical protein [Sorangium sp. So ce388]|uniref:hypothetical protein n=1 Tax=Sorangium sp. So ce388 TaxID=3133309 RepID=UPI003F5B426A
MSVGPTHQRTPPTWRSRGYTELWYGVGGAPRRRDCLVTSTSGRCSIPYALMVHGSAVVYCVAAAVVMLRTPRPALEPRAALER